MLWITFFKYLSRAFSVLYPMLHYSTGTWTWVLHSEMAHACVIRGKLLNFFSLVIFWSVIHWSLPLSTPDLFSVAICVTTWNLPPSLSPLVLNLTVILKKSLISTLYILFLNIIFQWNYSDRKYKHFTEKAWTLYLDPTIRVPLCSAYMNPFLHPSTHLNDFKHRKINFKNLYSLLLSTYIYIALMKGLHFYHLSLPGIIYI